MFTSRVFDLCIIIKYQKFNSAWQTKKKGKETKDKQTNEQKHSKDKETVTFGKCSKYEGKMLQIKRDIPHSHSHKFVYKRCNC